MILYLIPLPPALYRNGRCGIVQSLERRIFGERRAASECSRCRHGCATSLHDDEDSKLGGKTVSEVRRITNCHKNEQNKQEKIIRKTESSGREGRRHKETRGNKGLKCMYANVSKCKL